MLCQLS